MRKMAFRFYPSPKIKYLLTIEILMQKHSKLFFYYSSEMKQQ